MKHFPHKPTAAPLLAILLGCASLAGCSRAKLELDPALLPGCAAGHGEQVQVRWDAGRSRTRYVQILINRPGGHERPWTRGKPQGARRTGRWGTDGLTFVLRDDSGAELARRTLETARCPRKQKDE